MFVYTKAHPCGCNGTITRHEHTWECNDCMRHYLNGIHTPWGITKEIDMKPVATIPTVLAKPVVLKVSYEEGGECPEREEYECMGHLELEMSRCYCNADTAPCHYCEAGSLICDECGWET